MKKIFNIGIILVVLLSMTGISSAAGMAKNPTTPLFVEIGSEGEWEILVNIEADTEFGLKTLEYDTGNSLLLGRLVDPEDTSTALAQTGLLQYTFTEVKVYTFKYIVVPQEHASFINHNMLIWSDISGAGSEVPSISTLVTTPEFPTIALPIAAILGLAFFFQRRREEE